MSNFEINQEAKMKKLSTSLRRSYAFFTFDYGFGAELSAKKREGEAVWQKVC